MDWRAQDDSDEKTQNRLNEAKSEPAKPWVEAVNKIEALWEKQTQGRVGGAIKIAVFIAALIVVSAFVLYMFGAFIAGDFNPRYWSDLQRFMAALLWFLMAGPIVIYVAIKNSP